MKGIRTAQMQGSGFQMVGIDVTELKTDSDSKASPTESTHCHDIQKAESESIQPNESLKDKSFLLRRLCS